MVVKSTWAGGLARAAVALGLVLAASGEALRARAAESPSELIARIRSIESKELAAGRDPSFDSVGSHFPAMRYPREVISVKDHRDEFVVLPDGRLNFTPSRVDGWRGHIAEKSGHAFFKVGGGDTWLGRSGGGMLAKKRLLEGYLPIVIADFEQASQSASALKYEQTAVAWSEGMSPDEPIWAFVRLKVSNPGGSASDVDVAWCVDSGVKEERKVRQVAAWKLNLAPGAEQTVYGKLPFLDGCEKAAESSGEEFDKRLAEASASWKQLLNKGIRINVPEQRVNDAYRAWLAYTFLDVDKVGDRYEPHDGAGFYEDVFGIAAAKYCNALGVMGFSQEARTYLDSLATMISPEGCFFVNFGFVDTGTLLVVMSQHHQLTGDEAWLRKAAPDMIRMCDWIIKKRKESQAANPQDSVVHGLVSSRVGVDNPGTDYSYVTDTSLCMGMEAAAKSLRALGMADEAARIEREGASYRQDIEKSMTRAVFEDKGLKVLPIMPETHKYLNRAAYTPGGKEDASPEQRCSGHGYYALFGSIILETRFLPAADARFRLIAELLERRDGLLMSMCAFGREGGIDHAFTYGYWLNCLERSAVERVLLGFYGSLCYGMSRDTWSGVECTNMATGANASTQPHLRSGMQQLRLLRSMLVREDQDRLLLAQAAPRHWFEHGKRVEVLGAPTFFGETSYTIESAVNEGRITARLVTPRRSPPSAIQLFVRHPQGKPIRKVLADGKPVSTFDAGSVTLTGFGETVVLELDYQ
jgi:hypothetical protein